MHIPRDLVLRWCGTIRVWRGSRAKECTTTLVSPLPEFQVKFQVLRLFCVTGPATTSLDPLIVPLVGDGGSPKRRFRKRN